MLVEGDDVWGMRGAEDVSAAAAVVAPLEEGEWARGVVGRIAGWGSRVGLFRVGS